MTLLAHTTLNIYTNLNYHINNNKNFTTKILQQKIHTIKHFLGILLKKITISNKTPASSERSERS